MPNETLLLPSPDDPGQRINDAAPMEAGETGPSADPPKPDNESAARCRTGAQKKRSDQRRSDKGAKNAYPSEDQCLTAIARVAGLVAMRILTTSQANSIRAAFSEILRWHRTSSGRSGDRRVDDRDLLSILRTNPELLAMIEPLLTDDQIELLARQAGEESEGGDGQA
jgi:hypothetical protein